MAKINPNNFNLNNPFNNKSLINKNSNYEQSSTLKEKENAFAEQSMLNIANIGSVAICQRCKEKESVFSCIVCESFKFLCTKCDNYVHSLPSKQAHQRLALVSSNKTSEKHANRDDSRILNVNRAVADEENTNNISNYLNNNYNNNNNINNLNSLNTNNSFDLNYKFNLSPINRLNALGKERDNAAENIAFVHKNNNNSNTAANSLNANNNMNLNSRVESNSKNFNIYGAVDSSIANQKGNKDNFTNEQEGCGNGNSYSGESTTFNSFKIPNASSFSREYLYEIKVHLFMKEFIYFTLFKFFCKKDCFKHFLK